MTVSFFLFTLLNVWFVTLFLVVPFFVQNEDKPADMDYVAAPKAQRWKKTLLVNTLVAFIATGGIALMIHFDVVPLRDMFDTL